MNAYVSMREIVLEVSAASQARTLKHLFTRRNIEGHSKETILEVDAFEANQGDRVCVVGRNGNGKTTFMKVLAGIYRPTSGKLIVSEAVTPVLAAGIGLEDEISVLDNIRLALALRNTEPHRVIDLSDKILDFCEISGPAIYKQFRHLSTGYKSRLAFAIATVEKPQILVLDEVLGGGDAAFMMKASVRLATVIGQADIAFIATHSPEDMRGTCNRLVFIENGKIVFDGNFETGISFYKMKLGLL